MAAKKAIPSGLMVCAFIINALFLEIEYFFQY